MPTIQEYLGSEIEYATTGGTPNNNVIEGLKEAGMSCDLSTSKGAFDKAAVGDRSPDISAENTLG